jgi:glycosyltransferase involved in cell wall biosynthesis
MENFSVTVIARNEAKTIPRLLKSIAGADEILILDTGSTDGTPDVVRAFGAKVVEVGERFMETPTLADMVLFIDRYGFAPTFTTESQLFNYAAARNHCMSLAENDWCFCPDGDEEVIWDLDELHRLLPTCDQLSYRFAFAHNPDGSPGLEFTHCKFLRKSKGHWVKKIHEVIYREPGSVMVDTNAVRLEHWQDHQSINRKDFLPKLEYAILEQENDDRNTYYLAREYYYHGMWDTAITMFKKAIDLSMWKPERGQAFMH